MSDIKEEILSAIEKDKDRIASLLDTSIDETRKKIEDQIQNTFDILYSEYLPWLISDLQENLFVKYNNWLVSNYHDANEVIGKTNAYYLRQRIYNENKDDVVKLLDKDNIKKIEDLNNRVFELEKERSERYF